jgi:hypothetical protein
LLNAGGEEVLQNDHESQMHSAVKTSHIINLTAGSRVLVEKLLITQIIKMFPIFYGTQRFNTVFTRDCQWTLSSSLRLCVTMNGRLDGLQS